MAIGGKGGLGRAGGLLGAAALVAGTGVAVGLFAAPAYAGENTLSCATDGDHVGPDMAVTLSAGDPADATVGDEVTFSGISVHLTFSRPFAPRADFTSVDGELNDLGVGVGEEVVSLVGPAFQADFDDVTKSASVNVPLDDVTVTAATAGDLELTLVSEVTGQIELIHRDGGRQDNTFQCEGDGTPVSSVLVSDAPDDGGSANPPSDGGGDNPPGDNGGGDKGGDDGNGAPVPGSGGDDDGGDLANTGASGVVPMTVGGIALVAAGGGLLFGLRRKYRAAHAAR